LSFRKAAEAPALTPSRDHQSGLEDFSASPCPRMNRALELTEGGREYLRVTQAAWTPCAKAVSRRGSAMAAHDAEDQRRPFIASEISCRPPLPAEYRISTEHRDHAAPGGSAREDIDGVRFGSGHAGAVAKHLLTVKAVRMSAGAGGEARQARRGIWARSA